MSYNGAFMIAISGVSVISLTGYFCGILSLEPTVTHAKCQNIFEVLLFC